MSVFLAKNGVIHGPISDAEYGELVRTGGISQYSWRWDDSLGAWEATDPAPRQAPVGREIPVSSSDDRVVSLATRRKGKTEAMDLSRFEAICASGGQLMAGSVVSMDVRGGEFTLDGRAGGPPLGGDTPVVIHLFDPKKGETLKLAARLRAPRRDAVRGRSRWTYQLDWTPGSQRSLSK